MKWHNLILVPILGMFAAFACLPAAAATNGVVISQVYGGGGNSGAPYQNDYIELFNGTGSAVDISDWSVQYASSTGSSWSITNIPASTTLQPGQYYLIAEAAGSGNAAALPTPDVSGSITMSGSKGKVALVNTTTSLTGSCPTSNSSVVDFIGFGSANCSEGSGAAPTLSNSTAALRADDGCTDTNNNNADFSAAAPTPRNTSTTLNPCAGGNSAPTTTMLP